MFALPSLPGPGSAADNLLALLMLLLCVAALWDVRTRTIPNALTGSIAALAPLFWVATGLAIWPDMAVQFGIGLVCFAIFAGLFAFNAMGGGDVKLIAAVALWLPISATFPFLLIMSLSGGALTLLLWVISKARQSKDKLEIPYGVAISFAGLWTIVERYFNPFG